MSTPSEHLAQRILDRLVREERILEKDRSKLERQVAEGRLNREDWRFAIELAASSGGSR